MTFNSNEQNAAARNNDVNETSNHRTAMIALWQAVLVTIITTIGGIVTGYIALPHKIDPIEQQGLGNVNIEGKWKYVCTKFGGKYQHGGRLNIQKGDDGSLILCGQRTWCDTKDSLKKEWTQKIYPPSEYLNWHSNWIFARNSTQIHLEYEIPMESGSIIGYCTGNIISENKIARIIQGNYYVVNAMPISTGKMIFERVSDQEYLSSAPLSEDHH